MSTDRRSDMTKLLHAFRNFAKGPKNQSVNAVYKNVCLFRGPYKHISTLWAESRLFDARRGGTCSIY